MVASQGRQEEEMVLLLKEVHVAVENWTRWLCFSKAGIVAVDNRNWWLNQSFSYVCFWFHGSWLPVVLSNHIISLCYCPNNWICGLQKKKKSVSTNVSSQLGLTLKLVNLKVTRYYILFIFVVNNVTYGDGLRFFVIFVFGTLDSAL